MSEIQIRHLAKGDGVQVANLIKQLTENIVDPGNLSTRIEALTDHVNVQDTGYRYMVATDTKLLVGFGGLVWYPIPSKGKVGFIEEIVVDEHYRGQGIASAILADLLDLAENIGLKQVKLTVVNSTIDPVPVHLYDKLGFVIREEVLMIRKYYQLP